MGCKIILVKQVLKYEILLLRNEIIKAFFDGDVAVKMT